MRNNWLRFGSYSAVALSALLIAACPATQNGAGTGQAKPPGARAGKPAKSPQQPLSPEELQKLSWLKGTPYETQAPIQVTMNASGLSLFLQGTLEPGNNEAVRLPIVDGKMGKPEQVYVGTDYQRTYIWGHPSKPTILMITNYQASGGPVIDLVWQAENGAKHGVPYNNCPDLPKATLADTFYGLSPTYSWDGATVIIPLRYDGLCLVDAQTGATRYIKYPPYDFSADTILIQPLPDASGKRLAYASIYHQSWPKDQSKFALLDLDSGEWVFTMDLDWVVHQAGGSDPLNLPLLVSGSRPTEVNTETKRQARMGLIDTASGTQKLLQFYDKPVWFTSVDAFGEYVVFMDADEKALARLQPASGKMDLDRRIYDEKAQLFCGPHGEPVFIWDRSILLPAQWNDSKQFQGYLNE